MDNDLIPDLNQAFLEEMRLVAGIAARAASAIFAARLIWQLCLPAAG
jgi:hypothetical protein